MQKKIRGATWWSKPCPGRRRAVLLVTSVLVGVCSYPIHVHALQEKEKAQGEQKETNHREFLSRSEPFVADALPSAQTSPTQRASCHPKREPRPTESCALLGLSPGSPRWRLSHGVGEYSLSTQSEKLCLHFGRAQGLAQGRLSAADLWEQSEFSRAHPLCSCFPRGRHT